MKKKKQMAVLLILVMLVSLFGGVGTMKAEAATPTWIEAYDKASYEMVSPNFTLKVGGTPIDVVQYFYKEGVRVGYSYAHLAYEGTATFEITCLQGDIQAVDASPHSYNMDVKIDGNKFTFDLAQKNSRYMVFDVRANDTTYQLIVAADPKLDLEAPVVDNVNVVNAKNGIKADGIDVGGLNSSDYAESGKSNTEKIQKIITWLSNKGGGTLYFPEGVYPFVTIDATSNVTLYLDKGAVLRGSGIRTDYDWNTTGQNGIQAKKRDIRIENVENFKIIGKGMVDANSIAVSQKGKTSSGSRELNNDPQPNGWYPDGWNDYRKGIVDGSNSNGIEFKGVTFKDATGWTFNIRSSKNVNMYNVKMLDDYTVVHSDGYDIVSCQDVLVENCFGVCGDDVFCPKGDISGTTMKNYLFKDCVAYAEGGAGCKIGVQARSDVSNIEFNNIDVIRGYRGFSIAHDEGTGNWDGIRFINIRTEKLHIPSFSTSSADNYGQYTATPFTLWLRSNGSVKNVEVTNCSFESISNLRAMIKGNSDNGKISDVTFNNLTMEGRTVTSLEDSRLSVGSYVEEASFKFNNTEIYNPTTMVYEAENATLANGAKTTQEDKDGKYSNAYKVSHLGLIDGKEGTATFNVNVEKDGEYDVEIYSITKGPRVFYVTVNDEVQKVVTCNGEDWKLQGRAITKLQLKAGENTIKLGNPNDAAPDLDKIEIINAGNFFDTNDTTNIDDIVAQQPISLIVQKDLLELAGTTQINESGLIGHLGGTGNGTATFHVQAEEAGEHILRLYYATKEERKVSVKVNDGEPVTTICSSTSDANWTTVGEKPQEIIINLEAGDNEITIGGVNAEDAPNIDHIAISLSDEDAQATVSYWIDEIPENVGTSDEAYVTAVKNAYDSLAVKDKIANVDKLEAAVEAIEGKDAADTENADRIEAEKEAAKKAEDQKAADAVIDAINKIGTVTLESEAAIEEAKMAYDALTEDQKKLVTNYEILKTAESELTKQKVEKEAADKEMAEKEAAKKAEDQKAADAVIDAINKIGTVTLESEVAIEEAKTAYDALTEDQKKLVTNYEILENAESELTKQKVEKEAADKEMAEKEAAKKTEDQKTEREEATNKEELAEKKVSKGYRFTYKSIQYKVTNANMKGKGTVEVIGPKKKTQKKVTIPATVKVKGAIFKVTSIRKNAFKNCKKLQKVTIGKNITKIGKYAFSGCSKLKTIKIQTKNLKSVGKNSFKGIHEKAKIKVPSSKLRKYKRLLKKKGQSKSVKITK